MMILKITLITLLLKPGEQNCNKLLFATNKICKLFLIRVLKCLLFLQCSFYSINILGEKNRS